jgi:hypothetical protein
MASNGQISTHLLQEIQEVSTFLSVVRKRLPREKTAPLGQTYWHQNRRRNTPRNRIPKKSRTETKCPALNPVLRYHPLANPNSTGLTRKRNALVTTGMAATNPVNKTPPSAATRQPRRM